MKRENNLEDTQNGAHSKKKRQVPALTELNILVRKRNSKQH
mgnify:CR=1 FL=1